MSKRKHGTITIKIDLAKIARIVSYEIFGSPGKGRKTSFEDRKKAKDKRACRGKCEE